MAVVSGLVCYPIKACAGVVLDRSEVTLAGLRHDRTYSIVDESGGAVWQGGLPRLAVVGARVVDEGIVLSGPGVEDLFVAVPAHGRVMEVDVEKWPGKGVDQGDTAAEWLSDVLGQSVRLVREPPGARSGIDPTALLVTSDSALEELNTRIEARGDSRVPMERFRPNVVVSGWEEPNTEDRVGRMTVGTAEFGFGELAIRCVVTMVDQRMGVRVGPEPIRTLADYRREPDGVIFGLKASVLRAGHVAVGDEVNIVEWR